MVAIRHSAVYGESRPDVWLQGPGLDFPDLGADMTAVVLSRSTPFGCGLVVYCESQILTAVPPEGKGVFGWQKGFATYAPRTRT